jgi:hypothetical protein
MGSLKYQTTFAQEKKKRKKEADFYVSKHEERE